MLKDELERTGSKVFYFHANQFSVSNFYNIIRPHKVISGKHKESVSKASYFQIQLRKIALSIDIWRFGLLRNKLRNQNYDYILSDRYFYDSVVNIEYLLTQCNPEAKLLEFPKLSFWVTPTPDTAIYLQTSPEKIMQRERVPDQGLEYLEKKKELYDAKTSEWNWQVIDGNRDKIEIFTDIKKML